MSYDDDFYDKCTSIKNFRTKFTYLDDCAKAKEILSYAQSPSVRQMLADTWLHTIVMQFRGYDLERLEEIG